MSIKISGSELTLTENCAPTYSTASDPRVDFFFHITEDAEENKTIDLLSKSWECHPLDTLKLIAYLRDCRNGKGIRRQYQMCLLWLFDNHYKTLAANLKRLVAFGYWKDLLHLLIILLFEGLIPEYMSKDDGKKADRRTRVKSKKTKCFPLYDRLVLRALRKERKKQLKAIKDAKKTETNETLKSDDSKEMVTKESEDSKDIPTVPTRAEALENSRRTFAENRYKSDDKYRKLYDKIVKIFAEQLGRDLNGMSKNIKSISLAGKWAPTNRHHFDKYLFISGKIGRQLCESMAKNDILDNSSLVADFYQREVCSPLRKYLQIPEVYMSARLWSQIDYNRVASKCMQKNKSLFIKHDNQRFEQFLSSKTTIKGAVLKPVELVDRGFQLLDKHIYSEEIADQTNALDLEKEVLEKQWLSLAEDIIKKGGGLLDNALAVCDVSGSMNGTPMSAAIGLTILVMSLSKDPWNSLCITFSESPEFHCVEPNETFLEKLQSIRNMKWGYNTALNKVFDLILSKAVEQRLTAQQMPKMLIIFTDMEFDCACPNTSLTNFEAAKLQFQSVGYKLPPILFWNLRSDTPLTSTPIQVNECGAGLMAGYSGQQLALILKVTDFEKMTALSLMRSAIDHKRYATLEVID